ncbi:UNVERIFIED_CONTAM: AhpC/TSA family protein, partial [Prevotella sp. 15_C9]
MNLVGRRFIADNKSAIWPLENLVKLHEQLEALQKNNSLVTQADIKKFKELLDKQAAFTKKQEETANSQYF